MDLLNLDDIPDEIWEEKPQTLETARAQMLVMSQSIVKKINEDTFCPARYKVYEIDKSIPRPSTEAQIKGQLFEYLALGSKNREGNIPVMKQNATKNKQGNYKSTDELRIESQAIRFQENLPEYGMELIDKNIAIELPYEVTNQQTGEKETILMTGIIDVLVDYEGAPAQMDTKCTDSLKNTYGPYAWGMYWNMNHLQAYVYTYLMYKLTGRHYRWFYYVVDLRPEEDYKLIEIIVTEINWRDMHQQITHAWMKYRKYESQNFLPNGSYAECKSCEVMDCPGRVRIRPIETFNT